jgi:CDP-glucose 4,6-dehydratase
MSESSTFSWRDRRVFLTGHTGFKGGWLALWLASRGAIVRGYALDPWTEPSLFSQAHIAGDIEDIRGDIRNPAALEPALCDFAPEVVFTDKCYENIEDPNHSYRETDPLGGYDPYSSSKACAEIVSAAYRQSFFPLTKIAQHTCAIATARAGNVIGGGDWSTDRLVPDLVRGFLAGEAVLIRRPHATRPWQHVLEPLAGYIALAEKLLSADAARYATAFNFGPADDDAQPVQWIVEHMTKFWGGNAQWKLAADPGAHEAGYLKLDASRAHTELNWHPRLRLETALEWLVAWYKACQSGADMHAFTLAQIAAYEKLPMVL